MNSFYLPFFVAVSGSLLYHLSKRSIPKDINPFFATIVAYLIGISLCTICLFIYPAERSLKDSLREVNWAVITVGIAVVMIELGFLLAYRAGWKISVAAVSVNVAVTIMLIPVGLIAFKDHLSPRNVFGLVLCMIGLALVAKK